MYVRGIGTVLEQTEKGRDDRNELVSSRGQRDNRLPKRPPSPEHGKAKRLSRHEPLAEAVEPSALSGRMGIETFPAH
jgi:hypothetical protein